ncbi:LacI family transcriptional regulator [Herbiconiux moechotypicola]|uniref:LacI family DNA-binding transcriptional regulator n=1 Tax=Herbiconiux moechotypicola TaxID=637393 RepID=A0ABN3DX83_9MICO|nr:LacI family DNA-binding transcriptional regulator [Herbiconiux moechotypicola]MCS5730786.1 LacI family transcriptional regulator [Herbiconiux moechotypicola]
MVAKPSTLGDVARLAQVSIGTASKALNGRGSMRPATRQRVQEAAAALRFSVAGPVLQAALRPRSGTVGLLTDDPGGRFALPILTGVEDALGPDHLSVLLCDTRGDLAREQHHLRALLARGVDGLIVVGHRGDPRPPLATPPPVPVVYALSPSRDPRDVSVAGDDHAAGALAARHVLALGRRRVVIVGGDPRYAAALRRADGAVAALASAGLEAAAPPVFGAWSEEWGRAAVHRLLDRGTGLDAVLCGSDQIARGAVDALLARGRRIPLDVAVVGHDNWEELAAHASPAVTSVDLNLAGIGERAAELLTEAWAGAGQRAGTELVPARLVVRATTVTGS